MATHGKRGVDAPQQERDDINTVEPHHIGQQLTTHAKPSRPSECLDDRPASDMSVAESPLAKAIRRDARQPDPGAELRAAREARGLSLEDIARTTKIGVPILTALEHNAIAKLPATIFTRGFLKAYAREVGLDPDETADLYLALVAPETLAVDGETARLMVAKPAERTEVLAYDEDAYTVFAARQAGRFGWLFTMAAVVGLAVYVWSFTWDREPSSGPPVAHQPAGSPDAAPASAVPGAGVDATLAAAAPEPVGPLRIQMTLQGPCWIVAAADGSQVLARLLQPGEQQTIEANEELVLRVGDPAALSYSINGREGRPLGKPGEPVNVRITRENFRDFLSS